MKEEKEISYYLKIDISGIQDFVFRVYGRSGVAKTLRARSFYLEALTKAVALSIKEIFNEVFEGVVRPEILDGGGSLEVQFSLPSSKTQQLKKLKDELENFKKKLEKFLKNYLKGSLGVAFTLPHKTPEELAENLEESKRRKFLSLFEDEEDGYLIEKPKRVLCPVCRLFFYDPQNEEDDRCDFCKALGNLGRLLPKNNFCVRKNSDSVKLKLPELLDDYSLVEKRDCAPDERLKGVVVPLMAKSLTDDKDLSSLKGKVSDELISELKDEDIEKGDIAPFEIIALYAKGDKKLGYLLMDVDNLGLFFSEIKDFGLRKFVSEKLNSFFKDKVAEIAKNFAPNEDDDIEKKLEVRLIEGTKIYILYAGGDDLFAIAPWNVLIDFALKINKKFDDFKRDLLEKLKNSFSNRGEEELGNVLEKVEKFTLSAGLVISRPKFTVRIAADWVKEAESLAKRAPDKNSIYLFGETLKWDRLKEVVEEANRWVNFVEDKVIPRGFFYKLLQLYKVYHRGEKAFKFYPFAYYFIARNLKDEELKNRIVKIVESYPEKGGFKVFCNYVLMATRGG
ncbi:type III-A CRISPR-associated protein Cas10/Csm1 [Thermovibrio sp.]